MRPRTEAQLKRGGDFGLVCESGRRRKATGVRAIHTWRDTSQTNNGGKLWFFRAGMILGFFGLTTHASGFQTKEN